MEYCRRIAFTDEPDYDYLINMFKACCKRLEIDEKTPDFIWNQNRLFLEREALKQQISKLVKKDKKDENETKAIKE
jgi:hypothetical protein